MTIAIPLIQKINLEQSSGYGRETRLFPSQITSNGFLVVVVDDSVVVVVVESSVVVVVVKTSHVAGSP